MDFSLSKHEEGFRDELRAWLAENLPDHRKVYPPSDDELSLHPDKSFDACRVWHKRLHAGGGMGGRWAFQALFVNRFGIAGGADQIQRNIIGERLLGLPK